MTALRASRAIESFVHLFKGGGVQGRSPCPRSAERGIPLYALISAGGGPRGNPRRGFPLFLYSSACAPFYWVGSLPCPAIRPHFFGACPKKRCRAAKEKRLFYPGGSTIRVSAPASVGGTFLARLLQGWLGSVGLYGCAVFLGVGRYPLLPVPPHFFALAQRNGVEPQRNALLGAATGAVGSHPPLPRTRSPNITADCVKLT